jgi:hypothetical protein
MPAIFALQKRAPVPTRVTVLLPSVAWRRDWERGYEVTRQRLLKAHSANMRPNAPGRPLEVRVLDEPILATGLLPYSLSDQDGKFECPNEWRLPAGYLEQRCENPEWRPRSIRTSSRVTGSV